MPNGRMTYRLTEEIGDGTHARVYRAQLENGQEVAVKRMRPRDEEHADGGGFSSESLRETATLALLRNAHPNIVNVQGIRPHRNGVIDALLPLCHGTLHDFVKRTPLLPMKLIRAFAWQLAGALAACHVRGIVHCDVKPENILMNSDGSALLLADFGSALSLNGRPAREGSSQRVTLWYRPIETLLGSRQYSCATDIWSLGCVVAELVRKGEALFPYACELNILLEIAWLFGPPQPEHWPDVVTLPHYATIGWSSPERACPPIEMVLKRCAEEIEWLKKPFEGIFTYNPTRRIRAAALKRQILV